MVVFHVVLLTDPFGSSAARFRTALQGGQGPDARTQKTEKVTSRTGKRCVKRASGTRGRSGRLRHCKAANAENLLCSLRVPLHDPKRH